MKKLTTLRLNVLYEDGRWIWNGQAHPTAESAARAFLNAPCFRNSTPCVVLVTATNGGVDPVEVAL